MNGALSISVLLILIAATAWGQVTTPVGQSVSAGPQQNGSGQKVSNPNQAAQPVAQPAYLTPISGVQGVLAETIDGTTIATQAADSRLNPASSVKLATTLVALQTFGPEHRFVTELWAAGTIDKATSTLNGNLIVTGRDPAFHYEHAVMVARRLNQIGIRTVHGKLIVAPGFTMNFDSSTKRSGEDLRVTLDSAHRSGDATRVWIDERTLLDDQESLRSAPSVAVMGEVEIGAAPPGAVPLLTHNSSRLVDVLKALLCYSNNFMAERIGETLGGPQAISSQLCRKLKISPEDLALASPSGLGVNRVTPRAMMKILRGLSEELQKSQLKLSDILPVAGVDPGTLEDRYSGSLSRGSVIAKTGTLVRTDGGASSLVGQMKTKSGRDVLFVIINQRGNVFRFRQNQDSIVSAIQSSLGGPEPFDYHPVNLILRLSDHYNESEKTRGQYEPKD